MPQMRRQASMADLQVALSQPEDVKVPRKFLARGLSQVAQNDDSLAQLLQVSLQQFFVNGQNLSIQAPPQRLVLYLIELLEVQVIHHRFRLERDALLLIAAEQNLPVFNHLQLEQHRSLVEDHHVNVLQFQPLRQFAEEVQLVIQELVRFDLLHQQDSNINIGQVSKRGAIREGASQVSSINGTLCEELVEPRLLFKQVHQ